MKIKMIIVGGVMLLFPLLGTATTKSEAKELLRGEFAYFAPDKKATRNRQAIETKAAMQCWLGVGFEYTTNKLIAQREEYLPLFRDGDRIVSVNGTKFDNSRIGSNDGWGGTDHVPVIKGDDMIWVVERDNENVNVTVPCLADRAERIEFMETVALALDKYKGKKCLDRFGEYVTNPLYRDAIYLCARIAFMAREINQATYNSYYYSVLSSRIHFANRKLESRYIDSNVKPLLSEFLYIPAEVNFFESNGSVSLARRLDREYDDFLTLVKARERESIIDLGSNIEVGESAAPFLEEATRAQPRASIQSTSSILELCAEKEQPEEKLMCFELAAKLIGNSKIETDMDSSVKLFLDAARRMRSTITSGISYQDYPKAVREIHYAYDTLEANYKGDNVTSLLLSANAVRMHYDNAKDLWDFKFRDGISCCLASNLYGELIRSFEKVYPQIPLQEYFGHPYSLHIDDGVNHIWNQAEEAFQKFAKEFN